MLEQASILIFIVIALALIFDFVNGFHDTANAIATCVSTRAVSPAVAIYHYVCYFKFCWCYD